MSKRGPLRLIKWHDSRGVSARWNRVEDVKNDGICAMESVGWIINESESHITVAPHIGLEEDGDHQCCGEMHIPKSCIDEIVPLSEESLFKDTEKSKLATV